LKRDRLTVLGSAFKSGLASLRSGHAFREFVRDPRWPILAAMALYELETKRVNKKDFIAFVTGAEVKDVESALNETGSINSCRGIIEKLKSIPVPRGKSLGSISYEEGEALYAIGRLSKPNIVVETGVAQGASSSCILQALEDNGQGELYSIDLPPTENRLEDGWGYYILNQEVGWIIPSHLKHRWHLILGDAREELSPLLHRLGCVDIFIHDSLHTFQHQYFEYSTAWPFIRNGGVLLSHDAALAFKQFVKEINSAFSTFGYLGGIVKEVSDETEA